jgi:hypothetical protein
MVLKTLRKHRLWEKRTTFVFWAKERRIEKYA